ncbi:MAG: hypothetical protein USCAAHI_03178 [Beijerinckiaceae bacterium]|nr:MAG: hypothetical protein USCAAHI_03178 [Beijerinckiaceae bacterium]
MNRSKNVVLDNSFAKKNRILEIITVPGHEGDEDVAAQRQIAEVGRRSIGNDVPLAHIITDPHQRLLVNAGRLVRALEFHHPVDIDPGLAGVGFLGCPDHNARRVDLIDETGSPRRDGGAGIPRHDGFHAGAHKRRVGPDKRHGLALHVGAHERAVGVIVLEEGNQGGGDRYELLWRDIHEIDAFARDHDDIARVPAHNKILGKRPLRVDRRIRLRDEIFGFLHRRKINHLIGDAAIFDAPVRCLDESIFIDPRESRERVYETDVRPFRRFDRADTSVMRRVHVAHLEASPLARETARTQRRQPPLMGNFGQRIGLVHELRQLRRPKELAYRCRSGFGIDQILRHNRIDIDRGHPLLDCPLHPQQAEPILILHEFADRADPAVAEMVDVVDFTAPVAQIDERPHDRDDIFLAEGAHRVRRVEIHAHVHLDPADRREIVPLRIEKQRMEHRLRRFKSRRLARAHDAVDIEQRLLAGAILIDRERVANVGADIDMIDIKHR